MRSEENAPPPEWQNSSWFLLHENALAKIFVQKQFEDTGAFSYSPDLSPADF
jgi:hypothetical protein